MIPFDLIDQALKDLGKNREWLAEQSGRSPGSIRSALAPNAQPKHRSKHLLQALNLTIEREIQLQSQPPPPPPVADRIVLEPNASQYSSWNQAALARGLETKKWAIDTLDQAADFWHQSRAAEPVTEYKVRRKKGSA